MRIPKDKWIQTNTSDVLGYLYASKGIDLTDNIGFLRVSPRLLINTSSSDDSDLGVPWAFKYFNSQWWSGCGSVLFKQASPDGSASAGFSQDAISSTPIDCDGDQSDMEIFNGNLYVTRASTSVSYFNGTSWSSFTVTSSGTADSKMLCQYGNRMYMTFGGGSYKITSWDSSNTPVSSVGSDSYSLNLGGLLLRITFMRAGPDGIWIGTINTDNGKGSIFKWNGSQTTPNIEYRLDSVGVVTGWVENGILYAIDVNGWLLEYNGDGFSHITRLPIPRDKYLFSPVDPDNIDRFIHPNGMTVQGGVVRVLVNGRVFDSDQSTLENFPSGVWEYTRDNGFYHKHSPSYTSVGSTTITDYGQKRISRVGALVDAKSIGQNVSKGTLLAGIQYYYDATNTRNAIFTDDNTETVQKYSQIVLPQIVSSSFTEMWQKLALRFRKFLGSSDSIVVKHRIDKEDPTQFSFTWVDTDTFTTTTDMTSKEGYEVEVLNGTGAGKCAHISSVSVNGSTWTVNLDDTFSGVTTGTGIGHLASWIKDHSYSGQTENYFEAPINDPSTVIQPKICFQITGKWDLYDLELISTADKKAT